MLVVKCTHANRADLAALRSAAAGANVRILTQMLTREEINTLMSLCDLLRLAAPVGGGGSRLAETMSLGKPVIATAYRATWIS